MHELGIVFYVIDLVEDLGKDNALTQVGSVTLEVGEVSGVLHDYLQDCWQWACNRSDLMRGCELRVEEIPAVTICHACGNTYPTVEHGKICPHCGSPDTVLLRGNEIEVKEIEAM